MKYFKGTIDGVKLSDLNKLDYTNTKNLKDRIESVDSLIDNEFLPTYFGEYYDVSPSQTGYLAEDDSVCKLLEIMGTYIIDSKDVESYRKVEYRFWRDEKDLKRFKEGQNINTSAMNKEGSNVEVIDMFVDRKKDKNQKIVKPVFVTKKDIKDIEELQELENAIEYLKSPRGIEEVKKHALSLLDAPNLSEEEKGRLTYIAKNTDRYIAKYAKTLRDNQLLIKKAIKRPIEFKNLLKDQGVPYKLDAFDMIEMLHVKEVLESLSREDLTTDIGIIIYDVNQLIDEVKLSPKEQEMISMFRKGYTKKEVTRELGVKGETTNKMMNRVSLKVAKAYENKLEKYRELKRLKKI